MVEGFALDGLGMPVAIFVATMPVKKLNFVVDFSRQGREIVETFTGGGYSAKGTAVPFG
mgnify:CR=1 FL=1